MKIRVSAENEATWYLRIGEQNPNQSAITIYFPLPEGTSGRTLAIAFTLLRSGEMANPDLRVQDIDPTAFAEAATVSFAYGGDTAAQNLAMLATFALAAPHRRKRWQGCVAEQFAYTDVLTRWRVAPTKEGYTRGRTLDLLLTLAAEAAADYLAARDIPCISIMADVDLSAIEQDQGNATLAFPIEGIAYKLNDDPAPCLGRSRLAAILPSVAAEVREAMLEQLAAAVQGEPVPHTVAALLSITGAINRAAFAPRENRIKRFSGMLEDATITFLTATDHPHAAPVAGKHLCRLGDRRNLVRHLTATTIQGWAQGHRVQQSDVRRIAGYLCEGWLSELGQSLAELLARQRETCRVVFDQLSASGYIDALILDIKQDVQGVHCKSSGRLNGRSFAITETAFSRADALHVTWCHLLSELLAIPLIRPKPTASPPKIKVKVQAESAPKAKPAPKPVAATPKTEQPPSHSSQEVEAAIRDAVKRWSTELSHLRSLQRPLEKHLQRQRDLQAFMVIIDPLRKYEIDFRDRSLFANRLVDDLTKKIAASGSAARQSFLAGALQDLTGRQVAEPGTPCNLSSRAFATRCREQGEQPDDIVVELREKRMIRQDERQGTTLSPIGTTAMEKQLEARQHAGSIGQAINLETFAQLEALRQRLAS